jgi:hypothetical protein
MTFSATFYREDLSFPVAGQAQCGHDGSWWGTFTFAETDTPALARGLAELVVDGAGIWEVMVLSTRAMRDRGWRRARFRVLKGRFHAD